MKRIIILLSIDLVMWGVIAFANWNGDGIVAIGSLEIQVFNGADTLYVKSDVTASYAAGDSVLVISPTDPQERPHYTLIETNASWLRIASAYRGADVVTAYVFRLDEPFVVYDANGDVLGYIDGSGNLNVDGTITHGGEAIFAPDFAGILVEGGGSITITTVNIFEQMTTFDTDMPEAVSNGAHGTDNITIGASGVYDSYFDANALSAANNKEYDFNAFEITAATTAVAFVTAADPCVISSELHGYSNGDRVKIKGVGGATGVNDRIYLLASVTDSTYALDAEGGVDVDGTGFGVWSSDGTAQLATKLEGVHRHRKFGTNSDQGAFGARSFESLTLNNTLELWILGTSDASNITVEAATLGIKRIQ